MRSSRERARPRDRVVVRRDRNRDRGGWPSDPLERRRGPGRAGPWPSRPPAETAAAAAGGASERGGRPVALGPRGAPATRRAAGGAPRHDARFPRAWLGDSYDFSFSGLKTAARRIVAAARAD